MGSALVSTSLCAKFDTNLTNTYMGMITGILGVFRRITLDETRENLVIGGGLLAIPGALGAPNVAVISMASNGTVHGGYYRGDYTSDTFADVLLHGQQIFLTGSMYTAAVTNHVQFAELINSRTMASIDVERYIDNSQSRAYSAWRYPNGNYGTFVTSGNDNFVRTLIEFDGGVDIVSQRTLTTTAETSVPGRGSIINGRLVIASSIGLVAGDGRDAAILTLPGTGAVDIPAGQYPDLPGLSWGDGTLTEYTDITGGAGSWTPVFTNTTVSNITGGGIDDVAAGTYTPTIVSSSL